MKTVYPRTGPMWNPPSPGRFLTATYLEPLGMSARSLAEALGVAHTTVTRVLNGQGRISPEMAVRLEAVLGRSAESWLAMQDSYDLWIARRTVETGSLRKVDFSTDLVAA